MGDSREMTGVEPGPGAGRVRAGAPGADRVELLGFMLSGEEYALDVLEVKEIVRLQTITPVPRSPAWIRGIVTLRGAIVPIFDVRGRFGLARTEDGPHTRIIVVYRGDELAGLVVDSITQVMRLPVETIEPPPQTIGHLEAEYLRGVAHFRDRLVILLNLPRVVEVAP